MAQPNRKRKVDAVAVPAPGPDWIVAGLAAAGALVAAYLTWLKLHGGPAALCAAGTGCDIVQASRYAVFLWVPTALWGLALYVTIGALAVVGLTGRNWMIAFLVASGGVGFSLYLTALSVLDVGATCVWCLTSGLIAVAILVALLMRRPAAMGRRPAARPGHLVANGLLAALAAVVGGAFVFAAPFSAPPGYQDALARHLAQTNAVMYGAYW